MSEDPIRWLDDPDAPPDIVSDLQQSAGDPGPAIDFAGGLAAIQAGVAAGAGAGAAGAGTGAAAVTKAGVSLKVISVVIGAVGLAAVGGYTALHMSEEPPSPEAAPAPVADAPSEEGEGAGGDDEGAEGAVQVAEEGAEAVDGPPRRRRPRPRDRAETPDQDDALQREIALLARARGALDAQPALALSLSERGHREFPDGVFYEEREATAVLALAALGRDRQAKRRGEAFLRRFPRGTFARRVSRSIDQGEETDESARPE